MGEDVAGEIIRLDSAIQSAGFKSLKEG